MKNILIGFLVCFLMIFIMGSSVENGDLVSTADVSKIDSATTDGLSGTANSLAYRVEEIEKHFHNNERFFGLHGTPSGEVTRMDSITTTSSPFVVDAGNDTWGTWLQIIGSGDTPTQAGMEKFDLHELEITDREHNTTIYKIQIGCDASGADAITNGNYTEIMYFSGGAQAAGGPISVMMPRYNDTTKCWFRTWAVGQNTSTMDFFIGLHEYEG